MIAMSATVKHGLVLVAPTIADQIAAARHAEARGFDSVWTTEFFTWQRSRIRSAASSSPLED
jgi:alkanesulfonate monooxygenase SsuD/methylene tetrahydromethanopterin reductase-like flavin-dependent oxidoreductase (luciferase family)